MEKSALLEDGQGRIGKQSRVRKQIADQQSRVEDVRSTICAPVDDEQRGETAEQQSFC